MFPIDKYIVSNTKKEYIFFEPQNSKPTKIHPNYTNKKEATKKSSYEDDLIKFTVKGLSSCPSSNGLSL